jgi:hypothetical protein
MYSEYKHEEPSSGAAGCTFFAANEKLKAVVLLQLFSLPFLLLTGFTTNIYLAVIGFLFRQVLKNAGNPIQMSLMMNRVPDEMKGIANSLSQMAFSFGWNDGPAFNFHCCKVWILLGLSTFYLCLKKRKIAS